MSSAARVRALLIDDEALARKRLQRFIAREPRLELVGEAATGAEALTQIERLKPDLIFLDVQMPGLDGFDVIRQVDARWLPLVIFVTAFDQHAVQAFEVNALDYLLKPVSEMRFCAAVERALARVKEPASDVTQRVLAAFEQFQRDYDTQRIPVRSSGAITFVPTDELDWAEVVDDYVRLHAGERTHLLRETMNELERRLPASRFLRIHRSFLVNLDRVREIQPWSKGDYVLILHDGTRLVSGRTYRERVRQLTR
jgi:two-component system, LytTR family, response regulator